MRHTILVLALVLGCGVTPAIAPRDCTPGASVACACPGATGAQLCGADGTLGACVCADGGVAGDAAVAADRPAVDAVTVDAPPSPTDVPSVPDVTSAMPVDIPLADAVPRCESRRWCGGDCVEDPSTDVRHCGACWVRCGVPAWSRGVVPVCGDGRCNFICAPGLVPCGTGLCVDPNAPGFDCRRCGNQCPGGLVCRPVNADRAECR